jgi:uncharacterized protein YqgV (UPF0045/DUF77 family)
MPADAFLLPEGKFEDVMRVIGQAHTLLHNNGTARVHSSISVSSR